MFRGLRESIRSICQSIAKNKMGKWIQTLCATLDSMDTTDVVDLNKSEITSDQFECKEGNQMHHHSFSAELPDDVLCF